MNVSSDHDTSCVFSRLEQTTLLIARHPAFPGKDEVLGSCRDDVEERFRRGALTHAQRTRLLAILDEEPAV